MAGAERLITAIREIGKSAVPPEDMTDVVFGTVVSVTPMKIEIENKFILNAEQLILSPFCLQRSLAFTVYTTPKPVDMNVALWQGLSVGDKVVMLRINSGQAFYVLHRAGGLV